MKIYPILPRTVLVCVLLTFATSFPAHVAQASDIPDLTGVWFMRFEQSPSNPAMLAALPDDAVFIDDSGAGELGEDDFAGLTLTQRGKDEIQNYEYHDELKRENTCIAPSVVFYMQAPFPIGIHQGRDLIVFQIEYFDMYRIIFMDGRPPPPADAPHSRAGHSVGHWEGDTLVVNTTHITAGTLMNNGLTHSDNIRLKEWFRISEDGNTLWATQLYEDPDVFAGKAARYMAWRKVPDGYIYPYDCDPSYGE